LERKSSTRNKINQASIKNDKVGDKDILLCCYYVDDWLVVVAIMML